MDTGALYIHLPPCKNELASDTSEKFKGGGGGIHPPLWPTKLKKVVANRVKVKFAKINDLYC